MQFTKHDLKFFEEARLLAEQCTYKFKLGAVIVKNRKIIGKGSTVSTKTHPLMYKANEVTSRRPAHSRMRVHAEVDAILKARKQDLEGCSIYIYRIRADSNNLDTMIPGMSRPCATCMEVLKKYNISDIYYVTNEGSYVYEKLNHQGQTI